MKKLCLFICLLFFLGPLSGPLTAMADQTLMYPVIASADDAEEGDDGPGVMDIDSSDLELVEDHFGEGRNQTVGLRFTGIDIPGGTEIVSAHIQFTCDEADKNNNPFQVTIHGEAADSAMTFNADAYNISSRAKTTAFTSWADIPDWTVEGEAGEDQRTTDLTNIVQEIVDRPGWEEGNALAFILEGEGTRTAESFDGEAELAPVLLVTFVGEQTGPSNDKYRLVWNDDPATTILIAWDQLQGTDPVIYYGSDDLGGNFEQYPFSQMPTRVDEYRGMNNHFAKLTGLQPDTAYYFVRVTFGMMRMEPCMSVKVVGVPGLGRPMTTNPGPSTVPAYSNLSGFRFFRPQMKTRPTLISAPLSPVPTILMATWWTT